MREGRLNSRMYPNNTNNTSNPMKSQYDDDDDDDAFFSELFSVEVEALEQTLNEFSSLVTMDRHEEHVEEKKKKDQVVVPMNDLPFDEMKKKDQIVVSMNNNLPFDEIENDIYLVTTTSSSISRRSSHEFQQQQLRMSCDDSYDGDIELVEEDDDYHEDEDYDDDGISFLNWSTDDDDDGDNEFFFGQPFHNSYQTNKNIEGSSSSDSITAFVSMDDDYDYDDKQEEMYGSISNTGGDGLGGPLFQLENAILRTDIDTVLKRLEKHNNNNNKSKIRTTRRIKDNNKNDGTAILFGNTTRNRIEDAILRLGLAQNEFEENDDIDYDEYNDIDNNVFDDGESFHSHNVIFMSKKEDSTKEETATVSFNENVDEQLGVEVVEDMFLLLNNDNTTKDSLSLASTKEETLTPSPVSFNENVDEQLGVEVVEDMFLLLNNDDDNNVDDNTAQDVLSLASTNTGTTDRQSLEIVHSELRRVQIRDDDESTFVQEELDKYMIEAEDDDGHTVVAATRMDSTEEESVGDDTRTVFCSTKFIEYEKHPLALHDELKNKDNSRFLSSSMKEKQGDKINYHTFKYENLESIMRILDNKYGDEYIPYNIRGGQPIIDSLTTRDVCHHLFVTTANSMISKVSAISFSQGSAITESFSFSTQEEDDDDVDVDEVDSFSFAKRMDIIQLVEYDKTPAAMVITTPYANANGDLSTISVSESESESDDGSFLSSMEDYHVPKDGDYFGGSSSSSSMIRSKSSSRKSKADIENNIIEEMEKIRIKTPSSHLCLMQRAHKPNTFRDRQVLSPTNTNSDTIDMIQIPEQTSTTTTPPTTTTKSKGGERLFEIISLNSSSSTSSTSTKSYDTILISSNEKNRIPMW